MICPSYWLIFYYSMNFILVQLILYLACQLKLDQSELKFYFRHEDPYILEGYFLTKTSYKKHKKYIAENIGQMNLDVFEYCLRQYIADDFKEVRKLYKETLME